MRNISEIHENVLQFLLEYRDNNPGFTFGLRTKNNAKRLNKGYWFYGNEYYVAIPFWTGRDWKNRTPNIFFKIEPDGKSFLECSYADSFDKKVLIERIKTNIQEFQSLSRGYIKEYPTRDYISELKYFLKEDKPKIDGIIKIHASLFAGVSEDYNRIDFFSKGKFEEMLSKISEYRDSELKNDISLGESIKSIRIENSNPKTSINIEHIPDYIRWVFITGNNGVGKSTVLKAVTAALIGGKLDQGSERPLHSLIPDTSEVVIKIQKNNIEDFVGLKYGESDIGDRGLTAFTAYGPFRNGNTDLIDPSTNEEEVKKRIGNCRSMFLDDAIMHNLDLEIFSETFIVKGAQREKKLWSSFIYELFELLPFLIPNLKRVEPASGSTLDGVWSKTEYILEDEKGEEFKGVTIEELSSGHLNLINFVGDMIVRLLKEQPTVQELTELKGVVIIDEIDIHLHPRNQKSIIEGLSETFSNIQFIVSTHSPICLLGAPKESMFFKVHRTVNEGIIAEQIDIEPWNLLPNTLLNSPFFDMEDLTNPEYDDMKLLKSKDDYNEEVFYSILDKMIDKLK